MNFQAISNLGIENTIETFANYSFDIHNFFKSGGYHDDQQVRNTLQTYFQGDLK